MNFFKLIVIFLFSLYNLYLYLSNNIVNYISERFFSFSLVASVLGLTLSAAGFIYLFYKAKDKKEVVESLEPLLVLGSILILGFIINPVFILLTIPLFYYFNKRKKIELKFDLGLLILIVVILGFAIPSRSLTSVTAPQRAGDFNSVSLEGRLDSISRFSNTNSYDIGDWIASINYNPDLSFYNGKEVDVKGFVFGSELLGQDYFNVSRFVVTCCAVDARPVGLIVSAEGWKEKFALDQWVNVKGKFIIRQIDGVDRLIIQAIEITPTEEPDRPYIY